MTDMASDVREFDASGIERGHDRAAPDVRSKMLRVEACSVAGAAEHGVDVLSTDQSAGLGREDQFEG